MRRLLFLVIATTLFSCSKEAGPDPTVIIPDIINGFVNEISVTPLNITTPDKGTFFISANNTIYKVDFNAVDQAQSNATLHFASDSILTDASREFANLGKDVVAYNPVAANEIEIRFNDSRKVNGSFDANTSFGGVFGEALISQWRTAGDPAKPNQKAKDDIKNFVSRYADRDGSGPAITPIYLFVTISKQ